MHGDTVPTTAVRSFAQMDGSEIATLAVAVYAASTGTAALVLSVLSEVRRWNTRVVVKIAVMDRVSAGQAPESFITFKLVNKSAHPVSIVHLGLEPLRRGGPMTMFTWPLPLPAPGPIPIEPRQAVTLYQPLLDPAGVDPRHRTRALAVTSDDSEFRSGRVRVSELLREQ